MLSNTMVVLQPFIWLVFDILQFRIKSPTALRIIKIDTHIRKTRN